jgi:hypothetical protein
MPIDTDNVGSQGKNGSRRHTAKATRLTQIGSRPQPSNGSICFDGVGQVQGYFSLAGERVETLAPGIGSNRIALSEFYVQALTVCIELVAGSIAEQFLFLDQPPLRCEHDRVEARAVAALACASPRSVDAMLSWAESEAKHLFLENLYVENLYVAVALIDALVDSRETDRDRGRRGIEIAVAPRNTENRKRTTCRVAIHRVERGVAGLD